jgi:CheY-like chemotaxis protein/HPt (histidine-containing phosphotransfer) domain-containing protein
MARRADLAGIPIIMLASERSHNDQPMVRRLRIARYLAKPFRRSDLFNAILSVVGSQPALPPPSEAADGADQSEGTPPLLILLAEDFADNRRMIELYLKKSPHQLDMAPNGQLAVEMFTRAHYDVVLMDIQMPGMDGYTATRLIRQWEETHHRTPTPILALTANALKGEVQKSLAAGCTAHLVKPIRKAQLLQAIMQYGESRRPTTLPAAPAHDDKLMLQVSAELEDLMPRFLANRRHDVERLIAALAMKNFEQIKTLGHGIKGAGGTYGLAAISELGAHIEEAATAERVEEIAGQVQALSAYLERIELVFV